MILILRSSYCLLILISKKIPFPFIVLFFIASRPTSTKPLTPRNQYHSMYFIRKRSSTQNFVDVALSDRQCYIILLLPCINFILLQTLICFLWFSNKTANSVSTQRRLTSSLNSLLVLLRTIQPQLFTVYFNGYVSLTREPRQPTTFKPTICNTALSPFYLLHAPILLQETILLSSCDSISLE